MSWLYQTVILIFYPINDEIVAGPSQRARAEDLEEEVRKFFFEFIHFHFRRLPLRSIKLSH